MTDEKNKLPSRSSAAMVDAFIARSRAMPRRSSSERRGRLLFAMDATASREPAWDLACDIQAKMFEATDQLGGLDVQLCFYRGFRDFRASPWLGQPQALARMMASVRCAGGMTQIERVLTHARTATAEQRIDALVFVGDSMEEDVDRLCHLAGELGLLGLPVFMFHEGGDPIAAKTFKEIARLSAGAYCPFDASSPTELLELLRAVAVYAAGGAKALEDLGRRDGGAALRLTRQVKPD